MIVERVVGDVFNTELKVIAFAVNTDGNNNTGFAGQVSERFWPELEHTGGNRLGDVLRLEKSGKTFYALVCHEIALGGWLETPTVVRQCLNSIPGDEDIALVLMGTGFIGQMLGADVDAILNAIDASDKRVHVYTL